MKCLHRKNEVALALVARTRCRGLQASIKAPFFSLEGVRAIKFRCCGVVLAQLAVPLSLGEKDAVGHDLDVGTRADAVGETDLVADGAARLGLQLLCDARGGGASGDPARLGMPDKAVDAAADVETNLRQ